MKQLTMEDIYIMCMDLKQKGLNLKELPIYLGNDDELNGIHCAWYNEIIDSKNTEEDMQYIIEMINESGGNNEIKDKAILIS